MANEAGLLRAILADPDDDAPRLVYADWLSGPAGVALGGPRTSAGGLPRLSDDEPPAP
jgi:hypothetical protein